MSINQSALLEDKGGYKTVDDRLANQTTSKLHTIMPRSFDSDTSFLYFTREKATCPYFPSAGFAVPQRHRITLRMPHQRRRVPTSHTSLIYRSIQLAGPLPPRILRSPTKPSTPPRLGPGRCCLSSRSRGSSARAVPTCHC